MRYEGGRFFQNAQKFMEVSKMQKKKIQKMFLIL